MPTDLFTARFLSPVFRPTFVAVLFYAVLPGAHAAGTDKTFIMAAPGDVAPGGVDTYENLGNFAISDRAGVFGARLKNAGKAAYFVLRPSGTEEIFRVGTVIPGVGEIESTSGNIRTNESGEIAAYVAIKESVSVTQDALIAGNSPQSLRVAVMANKAIPGSTLVISSFGDGVINDQGEVAFHGSGSGGGGGSSGFFISRQDGTVAEVARVGKAAPGGGTYTGTGYWDFANNGQMLFVGELQGAAPDFAAGAALFKRAANGSVARIITQRQAAAGGGVFYASIVSGMIHDGGGFVFTTQLQNAAEALAGYGIFKGTGAGDVTVIARQGLAAPDGMGSFVDLSVADGINASGKVAFISTCAGGSASSGLFLGDGVTTKLLCKAGQAAPGGGTFKEFGLARVNDGGTVLFGANAGGSGWLNGIYLTDGIDTIKVVKVGDVVKGRTVSDVGMDPRAFNGSDQVAFQVKFSDGDYAVLLFAPRVKWRSLADGQWEESGKWTAGLLPGDKNDVDIIPGTSLQVAGPVADTVVNLLSIGAESGGLARFNLGSGAVTAVAGVSVLAGGDLRGAGEIVGNVVNGSRVSPGNSPGVIDITGNYTQQAAGALNVEVAGSGAGQHDLLQVSGTAALAGELTVDLLEGAESELKSTDEITVVSAAVVTGTFSNSPPGALVTSTSGLSTFRIDYRPGAVVLRGFRDVDTDGDGIPDYWMLEHFGNKVGDLASLSLASADADGDGVSNLDEFIAGTLPKSVSSALRAVASRGAADKAVVKFPSVAGRLYAIKHSVDMKEWDEVATGIVGDGGEKTVSVDVDPADLTGFFRVVVKRD